ncbi:MAG: YceI family protein [Pseudomonadales bacterium]
MNIKDFSTLIRCAAVLSLPFLIAACATIVRPGYTSDIASLKPGSYSIDPDHSTVLFKVDHFGLSKYVGRFNSLEASLEFDPENIESTRLHAIVNTASIDVGDADFSKTLAGPDWFDSERYPQAVFTTESLKFAEGGDVVFTGQLEMLGKSQAMDISIRFNGGATNMLTGFYTIGFSASAVLKRSEFGMNKHLGLVGDDIELEIHAEFQKR